MNGFTRSRLALLCVVSGFTLLATTARGDGVAFVMTSKSIPEATIAVIDPESGTSAGGGTTDVRVGAGDVILFRFNYFPVPDKIVRGLQSYITEYIPANTQVVGVRVLDRDGLTTAPRYPGIAMDNCGGACGRYNSVPTSGGGTRNLKDGTIAQLYADTGVFYATGARHRRNPGTTFLTIDNGIDMVPSPIRVNDVRTLIGAPVVPHIHNAWDWTHVRAYGIRNSDGNASGNAGRGNTPFRYGSPVAGPQTFYRFEASEPSMGNIQFNDQVGPWNRVQYPGSLIGRGCPFDDVSSCTVPGTGGLGRMVTDAASMGHDLTPANPLPTTASALRLALGEGRVGEPQVIEVALRVNDTPLDPVQMGDVNCVEVFGGDTSASSPTVRAKDNPWNSHLASPACVFLKLKFDLNVDKALALTGQRLNYTVEGKNLSINPQTNAVARIKFDPSRQAFVSASDGGVLRGDCDADGLDCVVWPATTLAPSEEFTYTASFTVGGGGQVTNVMRGDFTSDDITDGFDTQALTIVRPIGLVDLSAEPRIDPTTAFATAGGNAWIEGEITNAGGTGPYNAETLTLVLPAGWRQNSSLTLTCGGSSSSIACGEGCGTDRPTYDLSESMSPGEICTFAVRTLVASGTPNGLYDIDLSFWSSQMSFGGDYETYFADAVTINVGARRSRPPALDCPILSGAREITGTTTEPDGTTARAYLNGIRRGSGTSAGGAWAAGMFGPGTPYGTLYGGLEVRATAQRPGELESEKSDACFVTGVPQCSDGLDNDGDGTIDFPADLGCSSAADGSEVSVACSDGIDNDGDGRIDFPDDPECSSVDDTTEDGAPQCGDGIDNDGDGDVDFPADMGCTSATDRTEYAQPICFDFRDNDGDGAIDFLSDPGCDSAFDPDEADTLPTLGEVRPRLLVILDSSGSMNWNTCTEDFTGGDGSVECGGMDVGCGTCSASECGDGVANDSRLDKAKRGLTQVMSGFGEVEYALMRFHQRPMPFACPNENASQQSGGWQGAGSAPCGGGFAAGDVLVDFSQENTDDLLQWINGRDDNDGEAPAGLDWEVRGSGTTPLAGSLSSALDYMNGIRADDMVAACRPYSVILVTDGEETCGGSPSTRAAALEAAGYNVYVIGFAVDDASVISQLNGIAAAGGTTRAIFVDDEIALSSAVADIVASTVLVESCNGADDDCDILVDEGFTKFCDLPRSVSEETLCDDPGERVCDGRDDNCNGLIDEGLLNACGECGPIPAEVCNGIDDDCDSRVDEGDACPCASPEPETCDNDDNDCDGLIDENLMRPCGSDVGECSAGTQRCRAGVWRGCSGTGPGAEICDGLDNDCDGVVDGISRPCGTGTGVCAPGTQVCVDGRFGACVGAIEPSTEICNAADEDCDGRIDEGVGGTGGRCGTDVGICRPGTIECVDGVLACTGGTLPRDETCDNIDEDCDDRVDEGVTGGPCGDDTGECTPGVRICTAGTFECVGGSGPRDEICDGLDNDCDTRIDEGDPEAGSACGDDTGECMSGVTRCVGGELVCEGGVAPSDEVCDGLDNDCDGVVDDGLGVGGPCGTDIGECVPGRNICRDGDVVCEGELGPLPEECDALDNDCDGSVDEELPLGGECGVMEGICTPGMLQCVDGREVCVGAVPAGREVCDCEDNDCDGEVDEAPEIGGYCPGESRCIECQCAVRCRMTEFSPCPSGRVIVEVDGECFCVAPRCEPESCAEETVELEDEVRCAPDTEGVPTCECRGNDCTFPCDGVVCEDGTVCDPFTGVCVADDCRGLGCGADEICDFDTLTCGPHPCAEVSCADGEACRDGICEGSCGGVMCDEGSRCVSGECIDDLCDEVACSSLETCNPETGECIDNICRMISCPRGTLCDAVAGGCTEDPCARLVCPGDQLCVDGECFEEVVVMPDAGIDGGPDAGRDSGADTSAPPDDEARLWAGGAGGCKCGVSSRGDTRGALFALGLLVFVSWRRRGGAR